MRYLLSQITEVCHGQLIGCDCYVNNIVTDSRRSGGDKGSLFVAIEGKRHNSHTQLEAMARRGVACFMVERCPSQLMDGCSYIVVPNSIEALQALATHHRQGFSGRVVAIVGSNGKTIVKEWVAQVLPSTIKTFRSPRSYNSQLGVALSILMSRGDEELFLLEAGISQCGEMQRLEAMIRPDVVVVTSIGDAHQDGFTSMDEKIREKMIMCQGAQSVIYHSYYKELEQYIESLKANGSTQIIDSATLEGGAMGDEHSLRNSQIVEALATLCTKDSTQQPAFELDNFAPLAMRLEVKEGLYDSVVVNDSYNSCVNSLSIALDELNNVAVGRKTTLILSPILQSGVSCEELYATLSKIIAQAGVDRVIGVGGAIDKWLKCDYYTSTEELCRNLRREDYASRALLLKGNRSSRFERLSHAIERKSHTTRLEVNLDAMIHNLNYFRSKVGSATKLVAMVKASSYGMGGYEVAQMLQNQGVDYLAVAFVDEGVALRERGISMPIIVLNADDDSFDAMIHNSLEPEIYSLRSLELFIEALEHNGEIGYPIHLKVDSGMHRLGFEQHELSPLIAKLSSHSGRVYLASIFSHLSCADEPSKDEFTAHQIELFSAIADSLCEGVGYRPMRHIANSAAMERLGAEAYLDGCRLGIGLYGYGCSAPNLEIAATLKSRVVQVKEHKASTSIGYGGAGVLKRDSVIATIPIGYADGLNRHLGQGGWSMLVKGCKAPIVGRVCMDSVMIDVTDVVGGVSPGDDVTIFSGAKGNTAQDMAEVLGSIPYEILTAISQRVKRVYLKE